MTVPEPDGVVESVITYALGAVGKTVPAGAVRVIALAVRPPVMALAAKSPVMVYVAKLPTVGGFTMTLTPAVPAAVIVNDGALAGTVSVEVVTAKLVYVPAGGLLTPAIVTVTASPPLIWFVPKSPGPIIRHGLPENGVVAGQLADLVGVLVTMCQPPVVSVTSTPLTPVKLELGWETVMVVAPRAVVLAAVKATVYVADAPATNGETARVTLFTDEPKVTVLVISWNPLGGNGATVPLAGVTKTATGAVGAMGLTPEATILTVPPDDTAVVRVRATPAQDTVAVGVEAEPSTLIGVTAVTTSFAAVPPDGV